MQLEYTPLRECAISRNWGINAVFLARGVDVRCRRAGDGAGVPRFCGREVERGFRRVECLLTIAGLLLTRGGQPSAGGGISGRRRLNYRADRLHPRVGRREPAGAAYNTRAVTRS